MQNSYWTSSITLPSFQSLRQNLEVDVCVIGGGITGLSTAYYLTKNGYNVCVLEKDKLANHTTRKYYSQDHF